MIALRLIALLALLYGAWRTLRRRDRTGWTRWTVGTGTVTSACAEALADRLGLRVAEAQDGARVRGELADFEVPVDVLVTGALKGILVRPVVSSAEVRVPHGGEALFRGVRVVGDFPRDDLASVPPPTDAFDERFCIWPEEGRRVAPPLAPEVRQALLALRPFSVAIHPDRIEATLFPPRGADPLAAAEGFAQAIRTIAAVGRALYRLARA